MVPFLVRLTPDLNSTAGTKLKESFGAFPREKEKNIQRLAFYVKSEDILFLTTAQPGIHLRQKEVKLMKSPDRLRPIS